MVGFNGARACDRRLSLLIEIGYLTRKRYIYGVAGMLSITEKARRELNIELPITEPRLDQIVHDIAVTDTAIYMMNINGIKPDAITSEKEIRHIEGFSIRKHLPDFTFKKETSTYCVEMELSTKAKERFFKNLKQNYISYDFQKWVVPKNKVKIRNMLTEGEKSYTNIEVIDMEVIDEYIKRTTAGQ